MRTIMRMFSVCWLIIALSSLYTPVRALDATVTTCDFASLQVAIADANSGGGTISITCTGTIIFANELTITNAVIINNDSGGGVTFDGNNTTRLFTVNAGASLSLDGFLLQNGFVGITFTGGAIVNNGGSLSINNTTLLDNSAGGGGAIWNNGAFNLSNSTLSSNSVIGSGGAIFHDGGTLTISNSTLSGNSAIEFGGAIRNAGGTINITNSSVLNNSAGLSGGGIYNRGTLTIDTTDFTNNSALFGGAILNDLSIISISNSVIMLNLAGEDGGAIYNGNGAVTITNSSVVSNSAGEEGGAIYNTDATINFINSVVAGNSAPNGGAIYSVVVSVINSEDTHYEGDATNNTCTGIATITDNGGNTRINAAGCPGNAPVPLDVNALSLSCNGDNAEFIINAGDGDFTVSGTSGNFPPSRVPAGLVTLTGPSTWTDITVTERGVNGEFLNIGGISCPDAIIIPPVITPAPTVTVTVLGCALDVTDGVELANAPDNTYCRVLMKNGGVVSYSGAIPADLISLGVILAVDVYRLEGGMSQNTFPDYARVCLAGQGRLFYMDGRNAPRVSIELTAETEGSLTCGWIPAPGTLILTN